MTESPPLVVEPFSSSHIRDSFACGYEALDTYIRRYADQDIRRRVSLVFVACRAGARVISGYYTLSASSFRKDALPAELAKKLPHYPVPAAILGRLAVDRSCHGHDLGEYLLMNCFERVLQASRLIAVHAIIADAKDEKARAFYQRYGFKPFADRPLRLFMPMGTLEQLLVGRETRR